MIFMAVLKPLRRCYVQVLIAPPCNMQWEYCLHFCCWNLHTTLLVGVVIKCNQTSQHATKDVKSSDYTIEITVVHWLNWLYHRDPRCALTELTTPSRSLLCTDWKTIPSWSPLCTDWTDHTIVITVVHWLNWLHHRDHCCALTELTTPSWSLLCTDWTDYTIMITVVYRLNWPHHRDH